MTKTDSTISSHLASLPVNCLKKCLNLLLFVYSFLCRKALRLYNSVIFQPNHLLAKYEGIHSVISIAILLISLWVLCGYGLELGRQCVRLVDSIVWGLQVLYFPYRNLDTVIINRNLVKSDLKNDRQVKSLLENDNEPVYQILYWNREKSGKSWFGDGTEPCAKCAYKNCKFTSDKKLYNSSHVVLFSTLYIHRDTMVPNYKFSDQMWVLLSWEPFWQDSKWIDFSKLNGLFNATWSWHSKSDITIEYISKFQKLSNPRLDLSSKDYAKGKTKGIAWFVSYCKLLADVHSHRLQYVRNLQEHITVDIFGPCGTHKCERLSAYCDEMLRRDYKFYLAFENSICDEYATEKVQRALEMNVVPVVLGGANYSTMLPPKSYIDVKDFRTPKDLAEYLQKLLDNDNLYNQYFQWRARYEFIRREEPMQCDLCAYVNKAISRRKVYKDLGNLWSVHNNCTNVDRYYKNVDKSSWKWQTVQKTYMQML